MRPVLSAEQMRAFDRRATEVLGVSSLTLMETAGRGATEVILSLQADGGVIAPCVVVAGAGNNAGDGFVVARRLLAAGVEVETFLTLPPSKLKGDAQTNLEALRAAGGKLIQLEADVAPLRAALERAALVVDSLFGTGLDREIGGFLAQVVDAINAAPCSKLALDLPSGLHADTGRILGSAVQADRTVTFAHPKLGLCTPRGAAHAGRVDVRDIGVPADPSAVGISAELIEADDVRRLLVPRRSTLHKSSAGRVLVVAGLPGKLGAALLSAQGA